MAAVDQQQGHCLELKVLGAQAHMEDLHKIAFTNTGAPGQIKMMGGSAHIHTVVCSAPSHKVSKVR